MSGRTNESADLVLGSGRIYTVNHAQPWAEAVAIKDGKFIYVGDTDEARKFLGPESDFYNLGGKLVIPGIVDAHTHPGLAAVFGSEEEVPIMDTESKEATLAWLKAYADENPDLPIIQAGFWPNSMYEVTGPRKEDLDKVVPDRPVVLRDHSGHSAWLNSKMLEILGVDRNTPDLVPGLHCFQRDANGEPTGWAKEAWRGISPDEEPPPDRDFVRQGIIKVLNYLIQHGVTTVFDGGNLVQTDTVYSILAEMEKEGSLPLRYEASHMLILPDSFPGAIDEFKRLRKAYGGERLRFNTMKIFLDGVTEIRTAAVLEHYENEPHNFGGTVLTTDELYEFILDLHVEEIDLHIHTVGDRAVRLVLDAVESAKRRLGELNILVTLCHLEIVDDDDFPRFKDLGVVANFTPHWHGGFLTGEERTLGKKRFENLDRVQPLLDDDVVVSFSSDEITLHDLDRFNPYLGIQVGHNRQEPEGGEEAWIMPPYSERLALEDLVKGYTLGGAKQLRMKDRLGSIEVGKDADLVVLDRNIFEIDRYEIHKVKPIAVLMEGEVINGTLL